MARKGSLSPRTYFPARGDILMDETSGTAWECKRSNAHPLDEGKIRYGLLQGFAGGDTWWRAVHSFDPTWLDAIDTIERKGKTYAKNEKTRTWQET